MTATNRGPLPIVLDGPSAIVFYRDRDVRADGLAHPPDARVPPVEDEDLWLSDEDVAASLTEESVFGRKAMLLEDEGLSSAAAGMPALSRTSMRRMHGVATNSRDLKRVPYASLGIRPPAADSTLYLLVPRPEHKNALKNVHQRLCTRELSPHLFLRVESGAYVPTPEFTFLLMAHYLDLAELIVLGMEMCGHYRLAGATATCPLVSRQTLYDQKSLTTPQRIRTLLDRMDGFAGIKRARRACAYLAADSASPMETALYLLLCLPNSLGGYGLPKPTLNAKRRVTLLAGSFTLSRSLVPDLFWRGALLDVEYDSEEFHASVDCLKKGARRALAMRAMSVEVIAVTKDVMYDDEAFDGLARLIAKALGKRLRKPTRASELQRSVLRHTVLWRS